MSKLDSFTFGNEPPSDKFSKNLELNLDKFFVRLRQIVNNGLSFGDNFNCVVKTFTTDATPGNATVITHNLKRVPTGIILVEKDKAAHIYMAAKDATTYTVKSDVASVTATVIVI